MLVFCDDNDDNIKSLVKELGLYIKPKSINFLLPESEVSFFQDGTNFEIKAQGTTIRKEDFVKSKYIFFLRMSTSLDPFVISEADGEKEKKFCESEWSNAFLGLLLSLEKDFPKKVWINRPSLYFNQEIKYFLILQAQNYGFTIPDFYVSNGIKNLEYDLVIKSLSADEFIDERKRFLTHLIPTEAIRQYQNQPLGCPHFFQKYIPPSYEVRIYYLLGKVLATKIKNKNENIIDIRDAAPKDLEVSWYESFPFGLSYKIDEYCTAAGLNFCCFDFIFSDNTYYLIDINPNGSWYYYEKNFKLDISKHLAEIIYLNLKPHT